MAAVPQVHANPAAAEAFRRYRRRRAAAEGVKDEIARITAGGDYSLVEFERLLRGVAGAFPPGHLAAGRYVGPPILDGFAGAEGGGDFGVGAAVSVAGGDAALTFGVLPPFGKGVAVGNADGLPVKGKSVGAGVEQDDVVFAGKPAGGVGWAGVTPNDFIAEIVPAKDTVHQNLGVGVGRVVNVQVKAAGRFQDAVTFHQPDAEEAQERRQILFAGFPQHSDEMVDGLIAVISDGVHPFLVSIPFPSPPVVKLGPGRQRVRSSVKILAFVKRRVGSNQVHRLRVQPLQERQVVALEQGSVLEVGPTHRGLLLVRKEVRSNGQLFYHP